MADGDGNFGRERIAAEEGHRIRPRQLPARLGNRATRRRQTDRPTPRLVIIIDFACLPIAYLVLVFLRFVEIGLLERGCGAGIASSDSLIPLFAESRQRLASGL